MTLHLNWSRLQLIFVLLFLNHWVFSTSGYKQTGDAAVQAQNVFYYLTYEGAVNLDAIADPVERLSLEAQINEFGQTPSQLFHRPHPVRVDLRPIDQSEFNFFADLFDGSSSAVGGRRRTSFLYSSLAPKVSDQVVDDDVVSVTVDSQYA
jgi:hypothetical protein